VHGLVYLLNKDRHIVTLHDSKMCEQQVSINNATVIVQHFGEDAPYVWMHEFGEWLWSIGRAQHTPLTSTNNNLPHFPLILFFFFFSIILNFFFLSFKSIWWIKCYFDILNNLYSIIFNFYPIIYLQFVQSENKFKIKHVNGSYTPC